MKTTSKSPPSLVNGRRLARRFRQVIVIWAVVMMVCCVLKCCAVLATLKDGDCWVGTPDYAGFYAAATILNEHSPGQLYNRQLQDDIFHSRFTAVSAHESLPFAHIPAVAFLLRPLARLPFVPSFGIWLIVLAVFIIAALAVTRSFMSWSSDHVLTVLLLTASFPPLMACWCTGQLSAVGMLWIALALRMVRDGRLFAGGAALSMCLYKPTLLMFALPIILLSGRFRLIAGMAVGGLALGGMCLWIVGIDGAQGYYEMLTGYTDSMSSGAAGFMVFKHIDLNAFFSLLLGSAGFAAKMGYITICAIFAPLLLTVWWFRSGRSTHGLVLALCATLTANAIFSAYTPFYDVALLIPNVVITGDIVYQRSKREASVGLLRWFGGVVALLISMSWVTEPTAKYAGFQPLTLVLLALCCFQIWLAFGRSEESIDQGAEGSWPRVT